MKLTRLAALVAASGLALSVPASATHSWGGYHWAKTGSSLSLTVRTLVTENLWGSAVDGAVSDWNSSTVLNVTRGQNAPGDPKKCSAITGQIVVCNAAYGQRGWLGIANIWLSNGHISKGTTRLNDSYFNMTRYNTPAWRNFVTCQEIGHDFGLDHQDENFSNANLGTCMDYTNDPSTNQHPNKHDYDMLVSIYGHDDGRTSAIAATDFGLRQVGERPAAPGASEAGGDSPSQWGRAIHTDGLGRPDVFEKDFGGGRKMITHVFWALETKRSDIQ